MFLKFTTLTCIYLLIGSNNITNTQEKNSLPTTNLASIQETKNPSIFKLIEQDSLLTKKELKRIKKDKKKSMYKNLKYKIGDGVTVTTGPMKGMYGVFIYYDTKMKYLIRFTGTQQMFFNEEDIQLWVDYLNKNK